MAVPEPGSPLVPDFAIRVNNSPLPLDVQLYLVSLDIEADTELPSMFTLELAGAFDEMAAFKWIDDPGLFAVGSAVEIKMGYQDDLDTVMIGEITGLEPEFTHDRLPSLTVRGYDRRHRLMRERKTRSFLQLKDSDIASKIASDAGLTAQADDSQVTHDYVLQANETDMEFLQQRARRIHYEVIVEDKTLFFRPVGNDGSEVVTLTMGDDLLEFYPRLSALRQVSEVAVHGWDPKDKKAIVGQARGGDVTSTMGGQTTGGSWAESAFGAAVGDITDYPILTQAEADQFAKAQLSRVALMLITGEGVCWGRTDFKPGQVIRLEGLGDRFSGRYYVIRTSQRYSPQYGYQTHFSVRRNAT